MGKTAVKGLLYNIPVIITLILSGITIIGSFTGHYNPAVSIIFPVLEVSLPILLILNLLTLVLWTIARKWWALVPLFALLLNWNYLTAVIQFHENTIFYIKIRNTKVGNRNNILNAFCTTETSMHSTNILNIRTVHSEPFT